MKAEIISVGTELLLGDIVNTNSQYLSSELAALGIGVYFHTTVGDNAGRLSGALELAVSRSNVIILTGGLGPTKDDITKETVCKALDIPLVEDLETKIWIESHYSRMKIPKGDNILKQAMVPEGATVFTNHRGTAPGLALESGNQCIIMLPGPPNELKPMVELDIRKFLRSRYAQGIIISHSVNLFGVSESAAAERLGELLNGENPTVAPYAKMGEVRIRITARAEDANTANKMIRPVLSSVAQMFHGNVYGVDKDSLQQAAVEKLKSKWCTVATAESCTAGLLAKRITDIPGSSDVFETGYITYSNAAKTEQLGVPEELLKRYGAVSPETAEAMAKGARLKSGAELGIAVTGIAGPGGGTPEKPVGLVYIALSGSNKMVYKKIQVGRLADREYVRTFASSTALFMLIDFLRNDYEPSSKAGTAQENAPDGGKTEVCTLPVKETGTAQDYAVEIEDVKENAGSKFEQIEEQKHDTFPTEDDMQEISSYSENTAPESVKKNIIGGVAVIKKEQEYGKLITDKKRSLAYRFFSRVLPWRGDSAGEKIRKLLFLVALTVLIVSGTFLLNYYMEGNQNQSRIDDLAEIYDSYEVEDDPELDVVQQSYNRFKGLLERNGDIVGWLRVPGTKINNPVMQSSDPSDPDYYLYRGFDKEETRYGSAYVDAKCTVAEEGNSQNLTIYGHHMRDGSMFASLRKYSELEFYKENPTFYFDTLYGSGVYKVFSIFITTAAYAEDAGRVFHYRQVDFGSEADFESWISQIRHRSLFNLPVDIEKDDKLVTLSTCTYELSNADLRYVVVGRKVREGEDRQVDVEKAEVNPKILYPQLWYDRLGGSKPIYGDEAAGEKWYIEP